MLAFRAGVIHANDDNMGSLPMKLTQNFIEMTYYKNTEEVTTGGGKLPIFGVKASYLTKLKQDLEISKDWLNRCKKGSEKYKWYLEHIEWLESEIEALDN